MMLSHYDNTCLMAIFHDNPGKLVPECLHSGFYWSKDYGGGGDSSAAAIRHAKPSQIATIDKPTRSHLQAG